MSDNFNDLYGDQESHPVDPDPPSVTVNPEPTPEALVTLRVVTAHVSQFNLPVAKGDTLVVTKRGEQFTRSEADDLLHAAAVHGITLTEVS